MVDRPSCAYVSLSVVRIFRDKLTEIHSFTPQNLTTSYLYTYKSIWMSKTLWIFAYFLCDNKASNDIDVHAYVRRAAYFFF